MPAPKFVVAFEDYRRIFRVIFTVLDDRAYTHRACIFFAMAGAAILREHYNLNAKAVSGAAAYAVSAKDALVATFGVIESNQLIATPDAFHCWIECEGYAIDFMSPVFQENLHSTGCATTVPRRMFQKPLAEMSTVLSLAQFSREGAFCLVPSEERTEGMIRTFGGKPASADLANICVYWYRRPPKRIDDVLDMRDDLGNISRLRLHGPEIAGVW